MQKRWVLKMMLSIVLCMSLLFSATPVSAVDVESENYEGEMIEAVASETGLAKTEVAKVLNAYTNTIVKTVAEGGEYTVIGFGKFYASQRQARTGRNPSTGVEIKIPAAMVPKFTAGKAFKDAVNAPKKPARKGRAKAKK